MAYDVFMSKIDGRKLSPKEQEAMRLEAVKAVLSGQKRKAVYTRLGITRQSLENWIHAYEKHGENALQARKRGRPPLKARKPGSPDLKFSKRGRPSKNAGVRATKQAKPVVVRRRRRSTHRAYKRQSEIAAYRPAKSKGFWGNIKGLFTD